MCPLSNQNDYYKVVSKDTLINKGSISKENKQVDMKEEATLPKKSSVVMTEEMRQQIEQKKKEAMRRKQMMLAKKQISQCQPENRVSEQSISKDGQQESFSRKDEPKNTDFSSSSTDLNYDSTSSSTRVIPEVVKSKKTCPLTPEQVKRIKQNRERAKELLRNNAGKGLTFSEPS